MTDRFAGLQPQYKERLEKLEKFGSKAAPVLSEKVKHIAEGLECVFSIEEELICVAVLKEKRDWVVIVAVKIPSRKIFYVASAEELEAYGIKWLTDDIISEARKATKEFVASFADWPLLD